MLKKIIEKPESSFLAGIAIPMAGVILSAGILWGSFTTKVESIDNKVNYRHDQYLEFMEETDKKFDSANGISNELLVLMTSMQKDIEYIKLFFAGATDK